MKTKDLVNCSCFVTINAILAQIIIPIGPINFSLVVISLYLTGLCLTPKLAFITQLVYLGIGLIGLPVFSGFSLGLGAL